MVIVVDSISLQLPITKLPISAYARILTTKFQRHRTIEHRVMMQLAMQLISTTFQLLKRQKPSILPRSGGGSPRVQPAALLGPPRPQRQAGRGRVRQPELPAVCVRGRGPLQARVVRRGCGRAARQAREGQKGGQAQAPLRPRCRARLGLVHDYRDRPAAEPAVGRHWRCHW